MNTEAEAQVREHTPEEKAFVQRIMAARALGNDFANIMARTGVAPDLAIVASMTMLSLSMMQVAKVDKNVAQNAVDSVIIEFAALCKSLGLSLDGWIETDETASV